MLLATQLLLSFKQQIFLSSQEDDELFEDYANSGFWDLKMLLGANNDIWVETVLWAYLKIYLYSKSWKESRESAMTPLDENFCKKCHQKKSVFTINFFVKNATMWDVCLFSEFFEKTSGNTVQ